MLAEVASRLKTADPVAWSGHVTHVGLQEIVSAGPLSAVGDICTVQTAKGQTELLAEVASVAEGRVTLVPLERGLPVRPGARVMRRTRMDEAPVGDAFAGRLVDAFGRPQDNAGAIEPDAYAPLQGRVLKPLERANAKVTLQTGLKALDGLLPIVPGQRVGIFAAAGVGKTTLVQQIARQADVDHCVLCLVGERGREVEAAWTSLKGTSSRTDLTIVAATSDQSAPVRVRAVNQALCLAEHWRGEGRSVLLVIDSVTRYAMALREIGLSAGAPPTLRAYTPNVFEALPRLVERCGAAASGGSITSFMTVLSETDDQDDPITEVMKSLLDGHVSLSRKLANSGHFPAIDIEHSLSRLGDAVISPAQLAAARYVRRSLATYAESRIMIESGIYTKGSNADIDAAIQLKDRAMQFLAQGGETVPLDHTLQGLLSLASGGVRA